MKDSLDDNGFTVLDHTKLTLIIDEPGQYMWLTNEPDAINLHLDAEGTASTVYTFTGTQLHDWAKEDGD